MKFWILGHSRRSLPLKPFHAFAALPSLYLSVYRSKFGVVGIKPILRNLSDLIAAWTFRPLSEEVLAAAFACTVRTLDHQPLPLCFGLAPRRYAARP